MIGFPKTLTDFSKAGQTFSQNREWQNGFKQQAQFYLDNQSFFSQKTEGWKYFPFPKVMRQNFNFHLPKPPLKRASIAPVFSPSSFLLSIHNGHVSPPPQTKDFSIISWKEFLQSKINLDSQVEKNIFLALKTQRNPFGSLSSALSMDGLIIIVKKTLEQPLEIHYSHNSADQQGINLRNFIFIEPSAKAQIAEVFYGQKENNSLFLNIQTDCFVGEKAQLEHSRWDQMGKRDVIINQLFSKLYPSAKACFFSLSLNANVGRWTAELEQEEKTVSEIRGLSFLKDSQCADHKAGALHKGFKGKSCQLYKSFLFDSAKQVFQGWTSIGQPAQKSIARQLSKNFLFGKRAFAMAFPELDITADNVQATHGATVSPFTENKNLLFYLQSRGIDPALAFDMILFGQIEEALSCLQTRAKNLAQSLIQEKINFIEAKMKHAVSMF